MRVGLTGGVGAGKSSVAALLVERGAVVIDADAVAREVVQPGTPGYAAVVEHFGASVVGADGGLNRAALAAIVFADAGQRNALNAIVHPLVRRRSGELMAAAPAGAIVVYDMPLLVEHGSAADFDVVVVVLADVDVRLRRLADRGMPADDARARMANQAGDDERRAVANEVVVNDGDRAALATQVDRLWRRLQAHCGQPSGDEAV